LNILYIGRDAIQVLSPNESGNSWADADRDPPLPTRGHLASVQAMDLLGNGTACLVWVVATEYRTPRRPMALSGFDGGQKPHLLVKTIITSAQKPISSTPLDQVYLQDQLAGQTLGDKITLPVHVSKRSPSRTSGGRPLSPVHTPIITAISTAPEREFRGFGRVEQAGCGVLWPNSNKAMPAVLY